MSNNLTYSVVSENYGLNVPINVVYRCFRNRIHSNEPSLYKYNIINTQVNLYKSGNLACFSRSVTPSH